MISFSRLSRVFAVAVAVVPVFSVSVAAQITVTSVDATWQNSVPGSPSVTIDNSGTTNKARWGTGVTLANQSGYDFTPNTSLLALPTNGAQFFLGTFAHLNNPINPPSLSTIELNFSLALSGTNPLTFNQVFQFTHDETPNEGVCPFGPANGTGVNANGCADRMTFGSTASTTPFTFGGDSYFLNIIGFSTDNGVTTTPDLLTKENFTTEAELYGNLVKRDPFTTVPEPSTYTLLAAGLAALGVAARRRRRRSSQLVA